MRYLPIQQLLGFEEIPKKFQFLKTFPKPFGKIMGHPQRKGAQPFFKNPLF